MKTNKLNGNGTAKHRFNHVKKFELTYLHRDGLRSTWIYAHSRQRAFKLLMLAHSPKTIVMSEQVLINEVV